MTGRHQIHTVALIVLLLGCSDDLPSAPPVEVPFTMFGVVNPTADTQAVIVYPVESGTLEPTRVEPLDAVVRSTELPSGETRVWRDSVFWDATSGYAHIFWSDFRAEYGQAYRVEVARSDGSKSVATVRVPQQIAVAEQSDTTGIVDLTFRGGTFRLVQLDLTYTVSVAFSNTVECPAVARHFKYTFSHAGEELRQEGGWDLSVDLGQYKDLMEELIRQDTGCFFLMTDRHSTEIALNDLDLRVTFGDEAWDLPPEFLDRLVLSHPGTLTNVENGLGFVGAGYRDRIALTPTREAVDEAGFYDCFENQSGCVRFGG